LAQAPPPEDCIWPNLLLLSPEGHRRSIGFYGHVRSRRPSRQPKSWSRYRLGQRSVDFLPLLRHVLHTNVLKAASQSHNAVGKGYIRLSGELPHLKTGGGLAAYVEAAPLLLLKPDTPDVCPEVPLASPITAAEPVIGLKIWPKTPSDRLLVPAASNSPPCSNSNFGQVRDQWHGLGPLPTLNA
jgi:hypothetical protein